MTRQTVSKHYTRRSARKVRESLQADLKPHSRYRYDVERTLRGRHRWRVVRVNRREEGKKVQS